MDAATKRSSYPGYYGWAGRAMNTDRSLAVDSNQGLVFESPYTTPPEMTPMTYSTGTIATVSGTCSLFTIPTTAYYQVNIMADVQSTVLGSETYFVFAYWTNGFGHLVEHLQRQAGGHYRMGCPDSVHPLMDPWCWRRDRRLASRSR